MKKNYVLDTNILLHDPGAIFRFDDNNVIIPIYVIEEVDQFKRDGSERGRNARQVVRRQRVGDQPDAHPDQPPANPSYRSRPPPRRGYR